MRRPGMVTMASPPSATVAMVARIDGSRRLSLDLVRDSPSPIADYQSGDLPHEHICHLAATYGVMLGHKCGASVEWCSASNRAD